MSTVITLPISTISPSTPDLATAAGVDDEVDLRLSTQALNVLDSMQAEVAPPPGKEQIYEECFDFIRFVLRELQATAGETSPYTV